MKEYAPEAIRNVVLAGHAGSGKTTLSEACLSLAGVTDRQGRVEDGNTVSDFLPDEVKRRSSIHASLLAFEYSNIKFNLIDAPGYADFFGEVCSAMSAAEDCVLVANAAEALELGIEAGLERARDNAWAPCFLSTAWITSAPILKVCCKPSRASCIYPPLSSPTRLARKRLSRLRRCDSSESLRRARQQTHEIPIPDEVAGHSGTARALIENDVECDDALWRNTWTAANSPRKKTQDC
jgi:hypothetical protein